MPCHMELAEIHEDLKAKGATCPPDCPLCRETAAKEDRPLPETDVLLREKEQELAALRSRIEELTDQQAAADVDARIAEAREQAKAETDQVKAQLAELQAKYDQTVLEAGQAKKDLDDTLAYLQTAAEEAEAAAAQAAAIEAAKADRRAKVEEFASRFPENFIEENIDRWAALEEVAFTAMLEGWKAVAAPERESIPATTAMIASAASRRATSSSSKATALELQTLRFRGGDVRKIREV